jgi:hypothetical protein
MKQDHTIVRAAIHPGIGIARVGNSEQPGTKGYFIGPEVPDGPASPLNHYKDSSGALRRQAARFRIYGYNAAGQVVAELTPAHAEIEWRVHLANKKAAWYEFQLALDIEEASAPGAAVSHRRNPQVTGADRRHLVIDPGAREIKGSSTEGPAYHFDGGKFMQLDVELGELRTDEHGRLLVLGGHGKSQSAVGLPPLDFANNDGWHDDISDGPVDAKVTIGGKEIPVEGSWVVVAPPDYAPGLKTVRTLWDLFFDLGTNPRLNWYAPIPRPRFDDHIKPLFTRLTGLQWVNQGYASIFGAGGPYDAEQLMTRLADGTAQNKEFRQQVLSHFRPPQGSADAALWPPFYGDALQVPTSPRRLAALTATQYGWLQQWSLGNFDPPSHRTAPATIDEAELAERPGLLDRAALDYCLADAFHPGCELTWIVRRRSLYTGPLRLRRRPAGLPEPDYGDILTPQVATSPTGPLSMSAPGDLSRWMAVPWQTDTASCLSGYSFFKTTDSLPTFWPARVPNQVLRAEDFKTVMDSSKPPKERVDSFLRRENWFRGIAGRQQIDKMITDFHKLGIVEQRDGPADLAGVPRKVFVESKPDLPDIGAPAVKASAEAPPTAALSKLYSLRHFGKGRVPVSHA